MEIGIETTSIPPNELQRLRADVVAELRGVYLQPRDTAVMVQSVSNRVVYCRPGEPWHSQWMKASGNLTGVYKMENRLYVDLCAALHRKVDSERRRLLNWFEARSGLKLPKTVRAVVKFRNFVVQHENRFPSQLYYRAEMQVACEADFGPKNTSILDLCVEN
ncbi:MAG: hypothetical protein JSS66_06545 [Armatimonadetes bacterium]|nr:hypothetical protein [Armatimonadota bacterium]